MADGSTRGGFEALDPCVHCGFCLSACPTYSVTADESDSPRGRILLMRALERGELEPGDPGLTEHLDRCLGCRGCEPACPSGVGYGRGLEAARTRLMAANGLPARARFVLGCFRQTWVWRAGLRAARIVRQAGIARRLSGSGRLGFLFGMLDATRPERHGGADPAPRVAGAAPRGTVALFRGCVMNALFEHVHRATRRTLEANGYRVVEAPGQVCCGALHDHAGDQAGARALAQTNLAALADRADFVVVNSAGCGALLKDYGHLLGTPEAAALGARVRDVSELLADAGPRPGAPVPIDVCYDAPCHLQHAQRVHQQPLTMLGAIPQLRLKLLPGSDRCCGSAGIYGLLEPELSRAVLDEKLAVIEEASPRPALMLTGNPGCLMQIGAGLKARGLPIAVAHPVEVLDWSYRAAGYYGRTMDDGVKAESGGSWS
jgi:glycolate oxidase iron-sulfur subunit